MKSNIKKVSKISDYQNLPKGVSYLGKTTVPPKWRSNKWEFLYNSTVGDSYSVPKTYYKNYENAVQSVRTYGYKHGFKFTFRQTSEGFTVWRTK